MARESFFAAVHPDGPLDAVLLLQRTGKQVAAWTRNPAPIDILSVMGATGYASVSSIMEALGGTSPRELLIEAEMFRILLLRFDDQLTLLLVAATPLDSTRLREEAQRLARAFRTALPARRGTKSSEEKGSPDPMSVRTA